MPGPRPWAGYLHPINRAGSLPEEALSDIRKGKIEKHTLDRLANYTGKNGPFNPSSGRIYRKGLGGWVIFIVLADLTRPGYTIKMRYEIRDIVCTLENCACSVALAK